MYNEVTNREMSVVGVVTVRLGAEGWKMKLKLFVGESLTLA